MNLIHILLKLNSNCSNWFELRPTRDLRKGIFITGIVYEKQWAFGWFCYFLSSLQTRLPPPLPWCAMQPRLTDLSVLRSQHVVCSTWTGWTPGISLPPPWLPWCGSPRLPSCLSAWHSKDLPPFSALNFLHWHLNPPMHIASHSCP